MSFLGRLARLERQRASVEQIVYQVCWDTDPEREPADNVIVVCWDDIYPGAHGERDHEHKEPAR